jgi:mono/diheme cytochrome c family protein
MRKYHAWILIPAILFGLLQGCYYDKKETLYPAPAGSTNCDTTSVTYSGKVQPILATSCVGCHNSGNAQGGYDLSSHTGVSNSSARLLGSIKHSSGFSAMPKNAPKLGDCQILIIEKWLANGAPNN